MHPWPHRTVFFTGFMATGKSRLGDATARSLGWKFVDTDRYIEKKTGKSISEIFADDGEEYFRQLEYETVHKFVQCENTVVSLGGGALTRQPVMDLVKNKGILVKLWADVNTLSERIGRKNTRPLMLGLDDKTRQKKIVEMLAARAPFYDRADFSVESNDATPLDVTVRRIKNLITAWNYKKVEVDTPGGRYPIFIGKNFLDLSGHILAGLELDTDFLIVTDTNVYHKQQHNLRKLRGNAHNCQVFQFAPGEDQKSLEILNRLFTFMLKSGLSRRTTLLQFSGGVVGDMAGLGASMYQRGIPFVQIPTTLLAMVDSSVGGKVAVNHPEGKNMLGAFYQPKAVLINLEVLNTLEPGEYLSGLAEVLKYGVIRDAKFFEYLEDNSASLLNRDGEVLEKVVNRCCQIKAEVVGEDEKEHGVRAILNYGHTFGHAIEKITAYQSFSHGIAVSLGMRCAGRLATLLHMWTPEEEKRQNFLLDKLGFPHYYDIDPALAWEVMGVDKKIDRGDRVFILPTAIGKVQKVKNPLRDLVDQSWKAITEKRI